MENKLTDWQHNPKWNGKLSWLNISFLFAIPALTLILVPYCVYQYGITWSDFFIFAFMTTATGLGITVGYHRYFSHQTFDSSKALKLFFLCFGAATFQNSARKWSSDHRYHHRFVDKEGDPYNIKRGFFYAHMGWIFYSDPEGRSFDNSKDLNEDPLVMWQDKYYFLLAVLFGFALPTLIGYFFGRPFAGFVWGGVARVLFVHHGTFFINSLAHINLGGTRPYSLKNTARDSWWLAFFTNGEGFHNFHHAFANDYRNGIKWFHWDPSKWFIYTTSKLGLCSNLKRTPDAQILKAKLDVSYEQFKNSSPTEIPAQLESMRLTLEKKIAEFQTQWREFQAWKESLGRRNVLQIRARYSMRKLRAERRALESALKEYKIAMRIYMLHHSYC